MSGPDLAASAPAPTTSLLKESRAGGAGSAVALVAGLALDLSLAIFLGAGAETDALFVALRIPLGIAVFFPPTAIQVLVPAISRWVEVDVESANSNTSSILRATFLFSGLVTLIGVLLSHHLVQLLAPGLNDSSLSLAANLSRIAFLTIPAAALSQVFRSYRHARRQHGLASAAQAILSLTIVTFLVVSPGAINVTIVVWAYLVGNVAQLMLTWLLARTQGFRFEWGVKANSEVKGLGVSSLRPLAASAIQLGLRLVEQMVASFLAPGSITILTYANRLIGAVGGTLFFRPIVTAFLVPMSKQHALNGQDEEEKLVRDGVHILVFVSFALTALVAIAGSSFVSGLFSLGDMSRHQAVLLGLIVAAYSASLPSAALQRILLAVSFARLDTRPYLRNTVYGAMANLLLLAVLMMSWEFSNKVLIVPIAYGAAQLVNTWHAYRVTRLQIGVPVINVRRLYRPLAAIAISAAAMILSITFAPEIWSQSPSGLIAQGTSVAFVGLVVLALSSQTLLKGGLRSLVPLDSVVPTESNV